jgi:hypothetical protein
MPIAVKREKSSGYWNMMQEISSMLSGLAEIRVSKQKQIQQDSPIVIFGILFAFNFRCCKKRRKGNRSHRRGLIMVKALVKYKVLNIIERRQPISLSFHDDEILAEFDSRLDASITYRNLIAQFSDGATVLNPTERTIEVSL